MPSKFELHRRLVDHLRRAADVERAHGELGARLADRLRRDDADRLAEIDRRAAGEIAPVALAADPVLGLAGEHRADADSLDLGLLDLLDVTLLDQLARRDHHLAGRRRDDVFGRGTSEDALAERSDDLAGVDDRLHLQAGIGTAIRLDDDAVLRHVDKTSGQIARVRRLQRRVGEALARAVGGVEVLHHGQAFLEVRDDRALDDRSVGLGHQAAHAGELLHLRRRPARTGMRHHVDRVHRLLTAVLVLLDRLNALHHLVGHAVGAFRPRVDDLVVLLALGDQAVIVLLLVVLHELLRVLDELRLGHRDDHVVLAERDAGAEGVAEAERHDPVAEDDRLLLTAMPVDGIDHVGDLLLGHQLVDEVEGQVVVLRQELAENEATRASSRRSSTPACRPCRRR